MCVQDLIELLSKIEHNSFYNSVNKKVETSQQYDDIEFNTRLYDLLLLQCQVQFAAVSLRLLHVTVIRFITFS